MVADAYFAMSEIAVKIIKLTIYLTSSLKKMFALNDI